MHFDENFCQTDFWDRYIFVFEYTRITATCPFDLSPLPYLAPENSAAIWSFLARNVRTASYNATLEDVR
jgi:hypothetical protein